ncbi:hypothetical protein HMPREF3033_00154 [Veillonellaceae bacterium DNF00751]|nr:hypothetical protein HMPREF3033_00154 [Veillonellaceae bacterium DNF00751]
MGSYIPSFMRKNIIDVLYNNSLIDRAFPLKKVKYMLHKKTYAIMTSV